MISHDFMKSARILLKNTQMFLIAFQSKFNSKSIFLVQYAFAALIAVASAARNPVDVYAQAHNLRNVSVLTVNIWFFLYSFFFKLNLC